MMNELKKCLFGCYTAGMTAADREEEGWPSDPPWGEVVRLGREIDEGIGSFESLLEHLKKLLRAEACQRLSFKPGNTDIEGATIVVPSAQLRLKKGVDPEVLKGILGNDFNTYFETVTTYKPRKMGGDLISNLSPGPAKDILLTSVEEVEGTPRVSFKS